MAKYVGITSLDAKHIEDYLYKLQLILSSTPKKKDANGYDIKALQDLRLMLAYAKEI